MPRLSYTTPPLSLMRELREVAADAGALAAELANATANRPLPSEFPAEQLQELLAELQSLPAGTAEGCRQPLEYARAQLPEIRLRFIQTEEQSRQPRADEDAPPPLTRGMTIDRRVGELVNSVTTALAEYRALASVQDDDAADTAPSLDIDATAPDVVSAMAASQRTEQALGEHVEELDRIARPESVTADNLKRQLRDTRGLLSLARIELRMPGFVPLWYRKTIDTIRDYPRILRATATAMQIVVDVARPLAEAWHQFERDVLRSGINAVELAAKEYEKVAQKWEMERTGRKDEPAANAAAPPPYFNIEEAHAMILRGEAPPISWRPSITELHFAGENLSELAPLADLTALQALTLNSTQVSDLAPLAGLAALQRLYLGGTPVSDLAPLAGLAALERLSLVGTQVSDLAPLAGLAALQTLWLDGTPVSDLAPLAGLAALREVYVESEQRRAALARTLTGRGGIIRVYKNLRR